MFSDHSDRIVARGPNSETHGYDTCAASIGPTCLRAVLLFVCLPSVVCVLPCPVSFRILRPQVGRRLTLWVTSGTWEASLYQAALPVDCNPRWFIQW